MLLFVCFFWSGCGFQPLKYFGQTKRIMAEAVQTRLQEGYRFFQEGNYREAEKTFQSLQHVENPPVARQALYGLACVRLRLAENREQFLDAARLLDQWRRISPVSLGLEDPRMLLPFIPETMFQKSHLQPGSEDVLLSTEEPLLVRFYDYEQEIDKLLLRLADMEEQIKAAEELKVYLKAMETELGTLRNQIKSIETIDQEIQEKKQGISSP